MAARTSLLPQRVRRLDTLAIPVKAKGLRRLSDPHGRPEICVNEPASAPATPDPTTDATEAKATRPPRTIKRYSNRKLYDTESSKYVTLEEIAHMVKAGEEIVIIDNKTKDDLTSVTLTQIIYEEEKRKSRMPLAMLRGLITSSGDVVQDFFERQVKQPVVETIDQANKGVSDLRNNALKLTNVAQQRVSELTEKARGVFTRGEADIESRAQEMIREYEGAFEALKRRIDVQTKQVEHDGVRVASKVVERLEVQVGELGSALAQLRAKVAATPKDDVGPNDPNTPTG